MADYQHLRAGGWKLTVLSSRWNSQLQARILALVDRQAAARHPQTFALPAADGSPSHSIYLKIFSPLPGIAGAKDLWRKSKAARVLYQGLALSRAGFHAPLTIAAGERRRWRYLQRAFVLSDTVDGESLVGYLRLRCEGERPRLSTAEKRKGLRSLAKLIRTFHDLGFVHGDLLPTNIFVAEDAGGQPLFYLMDNDRTHRYPGWFPQTMWKRNLVQLNRIVLPGISLQDRMRFLKCYLGRRAWNKNDRCLIRWLERETRKRRWECERIQASVSFRELMRWNGPFRRRAPAAPVGGE
jgi:hypothetical protein